MGSSLIDRRETSIEWLSEQIADVVRPEFGGSIEKSRSLATAVLNRLREKCGGRYIYIASASKLRQAAIIEEFNGRNIAELAEKHGVSQRWVRRLTCERPRKAKK